MRAFFGPHQLAHTPQAEFHNGALVSHAEVPARAENILAAIGGAETPRDHGMAPIAAVHDAGYLAFLQNAWADWQGAGRSGEALPYAFPVTGRRDLPLGRIEARLGRYAYDLSTPIGPGAWDASYWGAQTALSALDAVLGGERSAFALCRPPGHHAGADYLGGYCYLNNAAIAAQAARAAGCRPAVLDIDYHHGNGTQDIFLARADVFVASIHADPATDYPYYWGHADERGIGEGEGANLNLPLPRGTAWPAYERALGAALDALGAWHPDLLVLSFGADTYEGDPISGFKLRTDDYPRIAARIAELGIPAVIVMEGGYAVDMLGANVAAFLSGF